MPKKSHGKTKSGTYNSWRGMKDRVLNPGHYGYPWYKEKGISIAEKWLRFDGFLEDMGERPAGMTLDRIDNNLGYCKENCRWASWTTQRRNRSDTKRIEWRGEHKTVAEWAELVGIPYMTVKSRLWEGWNIDKALTTPAPEPKNV